MSKVCPCCGQTLPADPPTIRLSPQQTLIFNRVVQAGAHGVSRNVLLDLMYRDDPAGGPLTFDKVLHVQVCQINRKLKALGKKIKSTGLGGTTRERASHYIYQDL